MAISTNKRTHAKTFKRTAQGGGKPKTSSMNKSTRKSYKTYRGQGR
jgi:hypothetical protein